MSVEFVHKEINDDTPIPGKYKTIGEVKNASIKSSIQVISRMHPGEERMYLCKWLFETHYLKKKFTSNLTDRIKNITNKPSYNHIITHCFDGIDPLTHYETLPILNEKCKSIIQSLHAIDQSGTGTFMDYLVRRLIHESTQEQFEDGRTNLHTTLDGLHMNIDKPVWQFNGFDLTDWIVHEDPDLKSNKIESIQHGDRFMELDIKDEWLKIEYKKKVGWVRYLVPDARFTNGVSGNIKDYVANKWFKKIEKEDDDNHFCDLGCKTKMEQTCWRGSSCFIATESRECVFPYCQNMCYKKVQDTEKYKTKDILKELYIVSCCHSEAFGECPSQDKFDKIMNILYKVDTLDFIFPLIHMCNSLILKSNRILLNPKLGCKDISIPADCDIVIDDTLIDIKCTRGNKDISEILQLLGYASLLKYNTKYNMRINNMCIINLLQGECKVYNIENMLDDNLLEYLNLLTNKYVPNKKIYIKKYNKNIQYPSFVNRLKNEANIIKS